VKAYNAKRFVVITEKSMRMFTADEQKLALLNLAVPSPIFRDTDPISVSSFYRESVGAGVCVCARGVRFVMKQVVKFLKLD
jgi:hypothetical protein